jgi:multidrug efflux pump
VNKLAAIVEAASTRLANPDDDRRNRHRSLPLCLPRVREAGARNSIGIMLVSGMIIGTVFTLFVVPSIYMLVARARVSY